MSFDPFILQSVKGNWGEWGSWSSCSQSCDGGNQTRIRVCNDPPAAQGGSMCASSAMYTETLDGTGIQKQQHDQTCNDLSCPSK